MEATDPSAQLAAESHSIPAEVQRFLADLYNYVVDRNWEGMKRLYEQEFNTLSEVYYSASRWPKEEVVDTFYQLTDCYSDVVAALYRELYYRHLLAKCPDHCTWWDRVLSSTNYVRLFEYFINQECEKGDKDYAPLPLPLQWQWDMMDEFVYQYQETQKWKELQIETVLANEVAIRAMQEGAFAWRAVDVLGLLTDLIIKSDVKNTLALGRSLHEYDLGTTLGYFAIISLMRLQVALGNYQAALEVASFLELAPSAMYWKVPAAHITLFYNLGFAYMMMRRYQDAIRVLSQILTYLGRSRDYLSTQSYQQAAMMRMTDRMYQLVMLCHALSPTKLEESISTYIQESLADKALKLQSDDEEAYREVFLKACPKFTNPMILDFTDPEAVKRVDRDEPTHRQLAIFLKAVSYQNKVFNVPSIAKLYNNLTLSKLANLMGLKQDNSVEIVRSEMLCVKNQSKQVVWRSGPLLSGERVQMLADLDISLEMDTIHVKNLTTQKNHVDAFLKQMNKAQELLATLNAKKDLRKAVQI